MTWAVLGSGDDVDLAPGATGPVCAVFLRAGCPVAELYAEPLADLASRFGPRGVVFVGVLTGTDDPSELGSFRAEHRLPFPVVLDGGGRIVAQLGATRTPEVVVLDGARAIRYRGRIDDRYAVGSRRAEPRTHDLADALADLLAGRPVQQPRTEAVGCPIARRVVGPATPASPTYPDVAPILARRCVACHRTGQIGPFPLTTAPEVSRRAPAIAEAVEDGRMPPWHADPAHGHFRNDARLTDGEKAQILAWIEAGCPEGEPIPPPADLGNDWRIARPDLILSMPRAFAVPAQGVVEYQYFEVDPGFTTDRWVEAAEIQPGNRRVVHHATVFLRAPGLSGEALSEQGTLGSFCLATMTPGTPPLTLPPGMAKRVPAGWRFVFVVHYAPVGSPQTDQTRLALRFADPRKVRHEVATNLLVDPDLVIPPGAPDHRVEQSRRFEHDVRLLALFPHMHVRGRSFRYEATFPDGRTETLLNVPRFDFAWQNRYELAEPLFLPAGSTIRAIATYDNSIRNPANPDPTATVRAGPQSTDEMFNGYYDFIRADEDLTRPPPMGQIPHAALVVGIGSALLLGWRRHRARSNRLAAATAPGNLA